MRKKFLAGVACLLMPIPLMAMESFRIKSISIEGLQRVSAETVRNYLPVSPGDELTEDETGTIIEALYQTGFFEDIILARHGNVLVVRVVERPTIGQLKISGNSSIPTDQLTKVMTSMGIAEGRIYDTVMISRIQQGLLNQYYMLGRYNARVEVTTTKMPQNRMLVKIDISEGLVAKVRQINIIGNYTYSTARLTRNMDLSTSSLVSFFTMSDRFSQEKFQQSLDQLQDFYMDRGYLHFQVKSSEVSVSPDRKSIFLTIVVDEGKVYRIKDIRVSGETILPPAELLKKLNIHSGDVFSRKAVVQADKTIADALGNKGYIYAVVTPEPDVDEKTGTVILNFAVKSGKRMYVRHISFTDNNRTNDVVLRRELEQMEGAPVSAESLENSRLNLNRLPFIRDAQTGLERVPGTEDQVDVKYTVKEESAAQASFNVSYGQVGGVGFGVGLNQKNFLGTGDTLGIDLRKNRYEQVYSLDFTNPYYTPDGVSRSFGFSLVKFNPQGANLTNSYSDDQLSLYVMYGIPAFQEEGVTNRFQVGYGYEETDVRLSNTVSQQIISFVQHYGRRFRQVDLTGGYSRDSRDRSIFPTAGGLQSFGINVYAPVDGQSLKYFLASWRGKWYFPVISGFIVTARGELGYGTSFDQGANGFPFFKNFTVGGIGSVRGYEGNTLGPYDSTHRPSGGNEVMDGTIGLVVPNPLPEKVRTELFLDGGNVYNSWNNRKYGGTASGGPRFSGGLSVEWLSPLGAVNLSFARALNAQHGDSLNFFQFQLGANFG